MFERVSPRRLLTAAAVATVLVIGLATRTYVAFVGVRVKVLQAPAVPVSGEVRVTSDAGSRVNDLRAPFAVILRVRNDAPVPQSFDVRLDGQAVCTATVGAARAERVDCAATTWQASGSHELAVSSASPAWSLEYVELATHHGRADGLAALRIVPVGSTTPVRPGPVGLVLSWLIIAGVALLPAAATIPRALRVLHVAACSVFAIALVALVASPWISRYEIDLSATAYWNWLVIVGATRLWPAATGLSTRLYARRRNLAPVATSLFAAALVLIGFGRLVSHALDGLYHHNYSGFVQISRSFFERNPLFEHRPDVRQAVVLADPGGYDAQFAYAETFDPFLRQFRNEPERYRLVVDAAPYRYGRIGFSLLTKLFSADRWRWYPTTMVWLILISLFACAFVIALLAQRAGASPLWGVVVLIVPGFWQSIQVALPEPVAAATLVAGYFALLNRRWTWATLAFAVSLLVRETGGVLLLCVGAGLFLSGRRLEAVRLVALSVAPLLLWRVYVGLVLYSTWGPSAFFFDPHDLGAPFGGFVDLWRGIGSGTYFPDSPDLWRAGIWYPLLLTSGWLLALVLAVKKPSATSIAAALYGLVAVSLNFKSIWVHVGNGQRGTYEMFLMLALTSIGFVTLPRVLRAATVAFWTLAAVYVFFLSFDASLVRNSLLS